MPRRRPGGAAPRPLRRRRAVRRDDRPLGGPATRVTTSSPIRGDRARGENLADWVGARAETARTDRFLARLHAQAGAASARASVAA
jgi:hypothetical protein